MLRWMKSNEKKKQQRKKRYHTFGCFCRSSWGDWIHWHVLIVCKLDKPFECSIRKKEIKINWRDGQTNDKRSESRKSNPESERRENTYKLLNVEQICLSDRGKARTQSKMTKGKKKTENGEINLVLLDTHTYTHTRRYMLFFIRNHPNRWFYWFICLFNVFPLSHCCCCCCRCFISFYCSPSLELKWAHIN